MLSSGTHHVEPTPQRIDEDTSQELKLPKKTSLSIILLSNALMQISFFVVVSSSNEYAHHLGGTPTFSGVVIGIPTVFSGLTLLPLMKFDQGGYSRPLHLSCASNMLGLILYALAYKANYLYLILIGRIVSGIGFSMWMYCKRYVSDPRLVGIRRRTMLASWLITGNGVGMCLGPFLGGVLYRFVGFKDQGKSAGDLWNGFTSPAWILAGVWAAYWVAVGLWFEDIPKANSDEKVSLEVVRQQPEEVITDREFDASYSTAAQPTTVYTTTVEVRGPTSASGLDTIVSEEESSRTNLLRGSFRITLPQFGVMFCMCWFAMTSFFVLGAWESNIPIFASRTPSLNFSPFASGNFLSLGALACFPFFVGNVFLARRIQDRYILMFGVGLGLLALLTFLILVTVAPKPSNAGEVAFVGGYAGAFMCWFAIALGFNLASTVTISLLSKQVPPTPEWNGRTSVAIQCSNYLGRVTGAVWGGSGVVVGMPAYVGLEIAIVGIGGVLSMFLWKNLKAKMG
ncbi:MFS general substrate transporter [Marasmius fiardii PR-910]|nr:MFS general substrate transporter [Marasmius fiardii PR-910]